MNQNHTSAETTWEKCKIMEEDRSKWKKFHKFIIQDLIPRQPPYLPLWFFILLIISTNILYIVSSVGINTSGVSIGAFILFQEPMVPGSMYILAAHGTLAYLFTNIASNKVETFTPLQATARFFAAIPIAAGVYFIGPEMFRIERNSEVLLGLVFLAGFSMEVIVQGFNKIAQKYLGLSKQDENKNNELGETDGNVSSVEETEEERPTHSEGSAPLKLNESPKQTTDQRSQS